MSERDDFSLDSSSGDEHVEAESVFRQQKREGSDAVGFGPAQGVVATAAKGRREIVTPMPIVAIADDFLDAYARIPLGGERQG